MRDAKDRNRRHGTPGNRHKRIRIGDPVSRVLLLFERAAMRNKDDARLQGGALLPLAGKFTLPAYTWQRSGEGVIAKQ